MELMRNRQLHGRFRSLPLSGERPMRIFLLNPPYMRASGRFTRTSRSPAVAKSGTLYYPIWLAYAAGCLEGNFEVRLLDAEAEKLPLDAVVKSAVDFDPLLIVIDTSTPSIENDLEVARSLKGAIPEAFLTLTGTHVSVLPQETLESSVSVDAVVRGELDGTLVDLAASLRDDGELDTVRGLTYRKGETVVHNPDRNPVTDLDTVPFVSGVYKRHLNIRKYFFAAARHPIVMIMTGRGCPNNCFFCLYPQTIHGRHYRFRSAENVVEEFDYIVREIPDVHDIGIEDDTFTANIDRTHEVCRLLINGKVSKKIRWWVNTRVDLDLDTMRLMRRAGCRLVIPGFESGVQELLDSMNKGITLQQSRRFMENARRAGLLVHGCFVVGAPGETLETMEQTLRFALELNPDTVQFFPIIPYPGTDAYEWARERGLLRAGRFSEWVTEEGFHNTVFDGEHVSAREMVEFCGYARRRFYMRPRYILYKALQCLRQPQEAKRTLLSARVFMRHLLPAAGE